MRVKSYEVFSGQDIEPVIKTYKEVTIMVISGREALRQKAAATKVGFFSKCWNPGETGIVFYPLTEIDGLKDLAVGAVWGHKADPKRLSLKTTFIPSLSEIDDKGNPIGEPDITYQFSRISKAFVDGSKSAEIKDLKSTPGLTESMERAALAQIEKKYDPKEFDSIKPVIQGLTYKIVTECIYVPIVNDVPQVQDAQLVSQDMVDKRLNRLIAILGDSKFAPDEECPYLQVQYSFPTGEKKQAGQTEPQGLTKEYRLETRYANEWKALKPKLETLPAGEDASTLIIHRNRNFIKFTESQILNAISTYTILNAKHLDSLDAEFDSDTIERLAKNGEIISRINLMGVLRSDTLIAKIKEELKNAEENTTEPEVIQAASAEEAGVAPVDEAVAEGASPTIQQLLSQPHIGTDEEISNLDFM